MYIEIDNCVYAYVFIYIYIYTKYTYIYILVQYYTCTIYTLDQLPPSLFLSCGTHHVEGQTQQKSLSSNKASTYPGSRRRGKTIGKP